MSHYAQRASEATDSRPARRTRPTKNTRPAQPIGPRTVIVRGDWQNSSAVEPGRAQARDLVHPLLVTFKLTPGLNVAGLVVATRTVRPRTLELVQSVRRLGAPVLLAADGQLWPIDAWRPTHTRDGVRLIPSRAGDERWRAQQHATARAALGLDTAAEVA